MKCRKCGYLGFETADRCRNCGYDFSLDQAAAMADELPLNEPGGLERPLADLELSRPPTAPLRTPGAIDLDRLLGDDSPDQRRTPAVRRSTPAPTPTLHREPPVPDPQTADALPLFMTDAAGDTELPFVAPPRPAGPPLAVRRATPEVPRGRPRGPRQPRREEGALAFESEPSHTPRTTATRAVRAAVESATASSGAAMVPASRLARLTAATIDLVLLVAIDVAVLYFTLQIAGLAVDEIRILPPLPMASFLLLLDGGYLAAMTAAGGRTIGKMTTGIKVMGDDGRNVDAPGALLRAIGTMMTVFTAGLPYLPALVAADGRTLADRLAGTRVVRDDG